MKKALMILTMSAALAAAQTAQAKKAAPAKKAVAVKPAAPAVPAGPVAQPLTLPKEAVAQPDGSYKYTDKNGKRWIFTRSFFGLSRTEDMSDPNAPAAALTKEPARFDRYTEDGDTIHFERQTPFGAFKWDRKKAELTEEEKTAILNFKPAEKQ